MFFYILIVSVRAPFASDYTHLSIVCERREKYLFRALKMNVLWHPNKKHSEPRGNYTIMIEAILQMKKGEETVPWNVLLLRMSAIYGFIGAFLGSHMAGAGSYAFKPIHAHILVVGWLSLFAYSSYYRSYQVPKSSKLAFAHVWTAIIGSIGLTLGMWMYNLNPFNLPGSFTMVFYIVGGSTLLLSFFLFVFMTFKYSESKK